MIYIPLFVLIFQEFCLIIKPGSIIIIMYIKTILVNNKIKFIRIVWKVYSSSTNKVKIYSYSIFVQQMYWLQDKTDYHDIAEILLTVVLNTITLTLCIFTHSWNSSSLFLLIFQEFCLIIKPGSIIIIMYIKTILVNNKISCVLY
jgi:hypothetical protein